MRIGALLLALLAFAAPASGAVRAYPSAQTIPPTGPIPGGNGTGAVALNAAIGEREGAWLVVTGASRVSATVDGAGLTPVEAHLEWAHYVSFGGRAIPDALLEWDGSARPAERANQPLYLQLVVPYGTQPGTYEGSIRVSTDGDLTVVPFSIRVFPVVLPQPGVAKDNFHTSFHLAPEAYLKKVATLNAFGTQLERIEANTSLYSFLASYRISPGSWGFGKPRSQSGYETSPKWYLDAAGTMKRQIAAGPFAAMRIPISGNRASVGNRIAGVAYDQPESWCDYLEAVRGFWGANGWIRGTLQYLYALDEPGPDGYRLAARQAKALHRCWPEAKALATTHPSTRNLFLYDGKGGDDLDIWTVLTRRFYGTYAAPGTDAVDGSPVRENLRRIETVRKRGKDVWSYTYTGVPGTPGYSASEPLSNPRMFLLWNALEGTDGTLYGQGTTSYSAGDDLDSVARNGEFVLLYPGDVHGPIASARLEQIRDGIEDALVFEIVRRRHGIGRVRSILGGTGLFSASAQGVRLACTAGCELKSATKFSWPIWSRDASTPARIEQAKLAALRAAS